MHESPHGFDLAGSHLAQHVLDDDSGSEQLASRASAAQSETAEVAAWRTQARHYATWLPSCGYLPASAPGQSLGFMDALVVVLNKLATLWPRLKASHMHRGVIEAHHPTRRTRQRRKGG